MQLRYSYKTFLNNGTLKCTGMFASWSCRTHSHYWCLATLALSTITRVYRFVHNFLIWGAMLLAEVRNMAALQSFTIRASFRCFEARSGAF